MPLTPWFRLDEDFYDSNNWTALAKCVGAPKRALNGLSDYYKSLPMSTSRAPILYGLTNLPGGWIMVIMEELKNPWIELLKIQPKNREPSKRPIKEAVDSLHANGYVHGDIRASNILVCPSKLDQGIRFIDFDEAGKAGEAIYPRNLNVKDIKRPDGAVGGQKILKEHDLWMTEELFVQTSWQSRNSVWDYEQCAAKLETD
jgi:serine/threonine protein kinase